MLNPGYIASLRRRQAIKQFLALFAVSGASALSPWPMAGSSRAAAMFTRQDATRVSSSEASALGGAINEMMERSKKNAADPKGWLANARAHDDFCSPPRTAEIQVHYCWWFLAWHRAFLVVTERKLREISGKSFSMPYWNWSSDRSIPALFAGDGNPFATAERDVPGRLISDGEVDFIRSDPVRAKLGVAALGARKFDWDRTESSQTSRSWSGISTS